MSLCKHCARLHLLEHERVYLGYCPTDYGESDGPENGIPLCKKCIAKLHEKMEIVGDEGAARIRWKDRITAGRTFDKQRFNATTCEQCGRIRSHTYFTLIPVVKKKGDKKYIPKYICDSCSMEILQWAWNPWNPLA